MGECGVCWGVLGCVGVCCVLLMTTERMKKHVYIDSLAFDTWLVNVL